MLVRVPRSHLVWTLGAIPPANERPTIATRPTAYCRMRPRGYTETLRWHQRSLKAGTSGAGMAWVVPFFCLSHSFIAYIIQGPYLCSWTLKDSSFSPLFSSAFLSGQHSFRDQLASWASPSSGSTRPTSSLLLLTPFN